MSEQNSNTPPETEHRCGYVTLLGRPNVGKSTLINQLIGQKLNITSRKPQTTQRRLLGIKSEADYQAIYIDTPGVQDKYQSSLNSHMNREVRGALADVNLILFVIDVSGWTEEEDKILQISGFHNIPVILLINKIDKLKDKKQLLPILQKASAKYQFAEIIPVSARNRDNLQELQNTVRSLLPEGPAEFPQDQLSDRSERFLAAEFVREKLIRNLGQELPYTTTVTVEEFSIENELATIQCIIWVEAENQKSIVIGKNGNILKRIGAQARADLEQLLACKVNLKTWVKVRKNWTEDKSMLRELGFGDS